MSIKAPPSPQASEAPESPLAFEKHVEFGPIERIESEWAQDPQNPLNWPSSRKWRVVGVATFQAFISPLASSTMAPSLPDIGEHYHITSPTVTALTLSIFLLAYAVGPLFFGPLSEVYGRKIVLNISNVIFLIFSIACIFAPNTSSLIAFRFFAGIGGSTPLSIGGAVVGDLFNESERAPALAAYLMGVLVGPPTGPIMGGYITETVGFKYAFVLLAVLAGISNITGFLLLLETYAPVIRAKLIKRRLRALDVQVDPIQEVGTDKGEVADLLLELSRVQGGKQKVDTKSVLWLSFVRPVQLLTQSFICFILSLYSALVYGYLNMFFTTFPTVFGEKYGFGPGATGLTYIGGGLGEVTSAILGGIIGNQVYHALVARNNGISKPEFRIPAMLPGSIAVPIGLLWYGWSAQARTHWIMPIIGATVFGFGMISALLPIQLYFVDAFTYSASALSASAALRALFAFAFPLFAPPMLAAMGLGGAYTFLAVLILIIGVPFPVWIFFYGERMRTRNPLNK